MAELRLPLAAETVRPRATESVRPKVTPTIRPRSKWSSLRLLLGDRISSALILAVASSLAAFAEAGVLTITAQVATSLVNGASRIHTKLGPITLHTTVGTLLLVAFFLTLIRLVLQFPIAYYPAAIAADVQAKMRRELFAAFTAASWDLQSLDREGHFQELMTNQIVQASQGAIQATALITSMFTFGILAISAFALNVVAAVAILVASAGLFAILRPLTIIGGRFARRLSAAQMQYAGAVGEANAVAEETQVFGTGVAQRIRVDEFIGAAQRLFLRTQLVGRAVPGIYQSLIYIALVLGLIAINDAHTGSFSSLGAVVLLLVRAGTYGQQAQSSYQFVHQSLPFVERLQGATDQYAAGRPIHGTEPLGPVRSLEFDRVSYAYRRDRPVLSELTFEVAAGETIGVVGPSGAGKSTVVQILLRLRSPDSGEYLINGLSAAEYDRDDWIERIAYVPQQPRLLYASVADNVRFFREIDDEAVERACRLARIHDEIVSWPKGYHTIVGPRADAVSGGQQQRICLARGLAADPDVVVLDEPTSALDPQSETLIQESLIALKDSVTLFIIAHRMSTLTICNRVMVILEGQLDAFDTLEALRHSNHYYRIASSLS